MNGDLGVGDEPARGVFDNDREVAFAELVDAGFGGFTPGGGGFAALVAEFGEGEVGDLPGCAVVHQFDAAQLHGLWLEAESEEELALAFVVGAGKGEGEGDLFPRGTGLCGGAERRLAGEQAAAATAGDCAGGSRRDLTARGWSLRRGVGDGAESSVERGIPTSGGAHVERDRQDVAGGHRGFNRGRDLDVSGAVGLLRDFDSEHGFERLAGDGRVGDPGELARCAAQLERGGGIRRQKHGLDVGGECRCSQGCDRSAEKKRAYSVHAGLLRRPDAGVLPASRTPETQVE